MKRFILPVLSLFLTIGLAGCDFDINQNPNNPTSDSMNPSVLLGPAEQNVATYSTIGGASAAYNIWMGYWGRSGKYGSNADVEAFQVTTTFYQNAWQDNYRVLYALNDIQQRAVASEQPHYQGVALILKSIIFGLLVDNYNDIVYTEAFKYGEGILAPKYDKGPDVYNALFADLDNADALLASVPEVDDAAFKAADKIFGGNIAMWRKFGNTVHLRLALRLVNVDPAKAKAEAAKAAGNGAGFLGAGQSAQFSPGYKNDSGKQNPFWSMYYKDVAGTLVDDYYRANEYIINKLKALGDPRLPLLYREIGDETGGGFLGVGFGETDQEVKNKHEANKTNMVSGPGMAKTVSSPQWIIPSFESLFLQAEAIQRGYIQGNAQQAFEAAVLESFTWLETGRYEDPIKREGENPNWKTDLQETVVPTYIENMANWSNAADKLRLIYEQKYIAMSGFNGNEVIADYRRTGYPDDLPKSLHPQVGDKHIPYRLMYPDSEMKNNSQNVPQGINPQSDKIFWAK